MKARPQRAGRTESRPSRPNTAPSTIVARHYLTRLTIRLRWREGVIVELEPLPEDTPADSWVAPGLVDVQVNGFAGVDFQADTVTGAGLEQAARGLQRAGCVRWLPALVTDPWDRMLEKLRRLRALRAASAVLQRAIAGWHVEGPFLSAEPGFCGAHDPALMLDPTPERIRELRAVAADDRVLITVAPERRGALAAIALATSLGMRVSLGHTDAPAGVIAQALQAGATGFTHLGNGCPQALDRHDNILWRAFEAGIPKVSLIPDGIHVSPALFRLAHRLLPGDAILYVSDAMAAAGAPPGQYTVGRVRVEVGADRIVRLPGHPYFAGSALRPVDGVWQAATMTGEPWPVAWRRFSQVPAEWLGLPWGLGVGHPADFCLLPFAQQGPPAGLRVFVNGMEMAE